MNDFVRAGCLMLSALAAGAQTQLDLRSQSRNIDFSAAASTRPFRLGTALPASCTLGETFFKTDAPAGANLYACTAANVWTLESGPVALGGDVSGPPQATTVGGLQGRSVSSAGPTEGQVLRWNAAASRWEPFPVPTLALNYSQTFTNQTVVTVAGTAHGLGTANLLVDCYDGASPAARLAPASLTVHPTSYDVTVSFATAQSGRCVVNGSGSGTGATTTASNTFASGATQTFQGSLVATGADRTAPVKLGASLPASCTFGDQFFKTDAAPGRNLYFCTGADTWTQMWGGQVASVFGRAGAVTAAAGDYQFSQIGGTVSDAQVAPGIDAAKIGAGTVSNTVFGYVAVLRSDAQAQLDAKAAYGHSHSAAGDATGDLGALAVTRLQGRQVAATAPQDSQALIWSAAAGAWQPGPGGGATTAAQLTDLAVTRTSSTVLTIGAGCSAATPCSARFGNTVYSFTRSCTATLSAGTGTGYIYVASGGVLTIGHNLTVAASSGCQAQPSVTNFPPDAIPLASWTAVGGSWDVGGGRDYRALLSTKNVTAGTGIATLESAGRTTVSVDTAIVPTYATSSAILDFPAIAPGACSSDLTLTLYGAAAGDALVAGWPSGLEAGLIGLMRVTASNSVAVRLCNLNGGTIDPASGAYRATIIRSF